MKLYKSFQFLVIFTGLFTPSLASLASVIPSRANEFNSGVQVSLEFPPAPRNQGRITGTGGGGTRGNCTGLAQKPFLTSLTPKDQPSRTLESNPTLVWYVPETTTKNAEFVVMDKDGNYVYTQELTLPDQPGLVKITIPERDQNGKAISLQPNTHYLWELAVICDKNDRSSDTYVWGTLDVVGLDTAEKQTLDNELAKAADNLSKAQVYAKYRIWNETLLLINEVKTNKPKEWQELLNSIGIVEDQIIQNESLVDLSLPTGENLSTVQP